MPPRKVNSKMVNCCELEMKPRVDNKNVCQNLQALKGTD